MNITLRNIDENNWRDCISLKVKNDQKKFVASNENGLAIAFAHKEMQPRGIYYGETMVGFLMYAQDPDDGVYYINRLMIDKKYQRKGFGTKALEILLNGLRDSGVESVDIIHKPDNEVAIKLYKSLGFKLTENTLDENVISNVIPI
ncbi:MAG: Spermine/spermidine acetyltransferase [Ignavibacteria bacterium]|nr:Spermine/spermidine acetyltransferase [Ignavibacteria bacterium]